MKNNRLSLLNVVLIFISTTFSVYSSANINGYDTSRIYKVMAKAKNGEDVKIAVFGGSITAGSLASSESKRWANLVTDWWKNTFSESNISLLNAGIGGTGSDIGVHRLYDDVLVHNPDLVIVEFAVNDAGINSTYVRQMMEGIVRQCYMNKVAVMFILLKMETMGTAQADHKIVGDYYMLPMVSWADLIDAAVAENGKVLQNVFGDSDGNGSGVHPNDAGMQYIADFLIDEFEIMYSNLPEDAANIVIPDTLPAPLISDNYDKTYKYNNKTLVAASNSGWVTSGNGWIAEKPGDEISFVVDGNAVSLIYSRHNDSFRGKAEVWVDDKTPQKLDAYWTQTWGPANVFCLVAEGLDSGQHTLHVKIIKESTTGNERHYFQILNVLKAGNIVTLAPIAKAGDSKKIVIGTDISLDGSDSFDPDSTTDNITYTWAIVSAPNNSAAVLSSNSAETSSITPDMEGYYKIGLIVNDGIYNSVQNVITIHAVETNSAPLADAGADAFSLPNEYYELNGSNSSDPDGDPLDYKWRVISYPEGTGFMMKDENLSIARFRGTIEGEYQFGLIVNDSIEDSQEDVVIITVTSNPLIIKETYINDFNLQIYPNPVKNILKLSFYIQKNEFVNISIINLAGETINELLKQNINPGNYNMDFNINLIPGLYFIQLKINNESTYKKIVIQ